MQYSIFQTDKAPLPRIGGAGFKSKCKSLLGAFIELEKPSRTLEPWNQWSLPGINNVWELIAFEHQPGNTPSSGVTG
jgi:hypothetical protein